MANRSIRTEIWNDEFISERRPLERLLYIYLLTNDKTQICGFYKITPATISAETGMKKNQIAESLSSLEPKIFYINGWICIKNYKEYQTGGGDKIDAAIENQRKRIPSDILDRVSKKWDRVSEKSDTPIVNMNTNMNRGSVRGIFIPPSVEEVQKYCKERGNAVDPNAFVDFYASKGWKVGNQPMKDWQAAVRTWEKRSGRGPVSKRICVFCRKDATSNYMEVKGGVAHFECQDKKTK